MSSLRKVSHAARVWLETWCMDACSGKLLVATCGVLLTHAGCGGALDNDNVLARTKSSGSNASSGSGNLSLGGTSGTADGGSTSHLGGTSGAVNGSGGGVLGAAGDSLGVAGAWAGAAGSDQCAGQCTDGRVCRKVVNTYECVTISCGPEVAATLTLPDKDGSLVVLGGGYAYVVNKTALEVADIHNPHEPKLVGELAGAFVGIAWQGNRLYLADSANGLAVVDVSIPEQPKLVTTLAVTGGVSCVRADGAVAYLCAGDEKQKSGYLQVVDLTKPDQPVLRGQLAMPPIVKSIDSAGPLAYLVDGSGQFVVVDATSLDQPATLASLSVSGASCVKLSGSRAFVGADDLIVIDVAAPARPTQIADIPTAYSIRSLSVEGNLVGYMSTYGYNSGSTVQVLDVSDLAQPTISPRLGGSAYEHWAGPMIALNNGFAYVASAGSLIIHDVSTPVSRRIVNANPIQYGNIYGMAVQYSQAYIIGMAYGPTGTLQVVNIGDPLHMALEGSFDVVAKGLAVRNQRAYILKYNFDLGIGDEFLELDLYNPYDWNHPRQIGTLALEEALTDKFNGQMAATTAGEYVYLLGAEVISIVHADQTANPEQHVAPELVRTLNLPGVTTNRIRFSSTHAFVTTSVSRADSMPDSGGLLVFDLTDAAAPLQVGSLATTVSLTGLELAGSYAYVGAVGQGLLVIDISTPSAPRVVGAADTPHGAEEELAVLNNMVYLGKAAVDVSVPERPVFRYAIDIPGTFRGVSSTGKLFTVTSGSSGKYGGWPAELYYIDPTRCAP